jgi:hypothetical protein
MLKYLILRIIKITLNISLGLGLCSALFAAERVVVCEETYGDY